MARLPRGHPRLRLVNTLNAAEYKALDAVLRSQVPTGAERPDERNIEVEILNYPIPAPLSYLRLSATSYNRAAHMITADFQGEGNLGLEKPKYVLTPEDAMAAASDFAHSSAVTRKYDADWNSLGIHLKKRASGNVYLVNQGRRPFFGASLEISTLPNFKKTHPKTLREDIETVLWLMEGLGNELYRRSGRTVRMKLVTRKPSDFYSLPPEFYK